MKKQLYKEIKDVLNPISDKLSIVDHKIKETSSLDVSLINKCNNHFFQRDGKKIRASFVLLFSALNGTFPKDIESAAVSVELLHAATLIHDDILDDSALRRGAETVSNKWDSKTAVLFGDFLYARSFDVALKLNNLQVFPLLISATSSMVKGELLQIELSEKIFYDIDDYFNIIKLKTSCFMGACAQLGALIGGLSVQEQKNSYNYGYNIGVAFQIMDDLLDFISDIDSTGKDGCLDYFQHKLTLPLLYLLEESNNSQYYIDLILNKTLDNWNILKQDIYDKNIIDRCLKEIIQISNQSLKFIEIFKDSIYKETIFNLNDFIINRIY